MSGRTTKAAENAKADLPRLMQALRDQGVTDPTVLKAIETTPRDLFTPDLFKERSWEDSALPIACGQTISQPYIVAYMTEQLRVKPQHRVLEVGTGSGYQAAVLSRLVREVVSIERFRTLADVARKRLTALGYDNVEVLVGDGMQGWPERAPFDRIIVTAAAEEIPQALTEQLADGGVMLLPLGPQAGTQHIVRVTKSGETLQEERLIAVRFVPLLPGTAREL